MKNIRIEFVDSCRYKTAGDYFIENNEVVIQVQKQIKPEYNFLIALHEFFEQFITERDGISEEAILAYDKAHSDSDEPGAELDSIYREQHNKAELVERVAASLLGVDWQKYEQEIKVSE